MSKNRNNNNGNNNQNNVPNNGVPQEEANAVDQNGNVQNPPATTAGSEKKSLKEKWNEAFDPETHPKRYAVKEGAKKVGKALGWMALGGVIVTGGLAVAAASRKDDTGDDLDEMDELDDLDEDLDDEDVIDSTAEEVEAE
ncbi:MAG: hypothetical protein J6U54_08705 [Clostridiales bacterium]|nr:hypothetical protein [Clostridiales bacterium]